MYCINHFCSRNTVVCINVTNAPRTDIGVWPCGVCGRAHNTDTSTAHQWKPRADGEWPLTHVPLWNSYPLLFTRYQVTITCSGLLNVHGWLSFSTSKNKPFTFQFDPNHHFDRSKWLYLGGPFAPDTAVNYRLFVLSPNNKLLATAGHWDSSFRIHSVDKGKLIARLAHHNGRSFDQTSTPQW